MRAKNTAQLLPDAPASAVRPRWQALVAAAVAAIAIGLYVPTLWGSFVYDDEAMMLNSTFIHDARHILDVLSLRILSMNVLDSERFVKLLSLMIDSALWGKNPAGYHLTNILLHGASTALLFLLALHLLQSIGRPARSTMAGALVGAVIFAVHPAASEAVCVVSNRADLLATFFVLLTLTLARFFWSGPPARRLAVAVACVLSAVLAVASKQNGVVVAPLLLGYWLLMRRYHQGRGRTWPWLALLAACLLLVGGLGWYVSLVKPPASSIGAVQPKYVGGSLAEAIAYQPRIWAFQLRQVFWPGDFCADLTFYSLRWVTKPLAYGILAAALAGAVLACRRNRVALLGVILYALALAPVSNFVPIFHPLADRYLYMPMVGIGLLLAGVVGKRDIFSPWLPPLGVLTLAVAVPLAGMTLQRERVWHDSVSLWKATLSENASSWVAANNLGYALYDLGRYSDAVKSWKQAVWMFPDSADAWAGLAIGLDALGQSNAADDTYAHAYDLDVHYRSVESLRETGQWTAEQLPKLQPIIDRHTAKMPASQPTTDK